MNNLTQQEVDAAFNAMFGIQATENDRIEDGLVSLQEHYLHLKSQGYSDDEIRVIFDLAFDEEKGGLHEI